MLVRNALLLLVLISLFSSCKKDKDPEFVLTDSLTLIAPAMDAVVAFDSITFTWEGKADTYRLQVNNGTIVDTVLTSKSYLLRERLTPGTAFSWCVIAGEDTVCSVFRTENIAVDYVGTYTMNLHKYPYGNASFPDSFWNNVTVNIQLADSNELRVSYSTILDKQLRFLKEASDDSSIVYAYTSGTMGQFCYFRHNTRTDSIYISDKNGGIGSGEAYTYRGKKQ